MQQTSGEGWPWFYATGHILSAHKQALWLEHTLAFDLASLRVCVPLRKTGSSKANVKDGGQKEVEEEIGKQ